MATFGEMLKSGPQLGLGIFYPAPGIIERIGPDWDWIWIDGQHGEMGYTDVLAAVRACNMIKKFAVVRVPGHDSGLIGLALDTATDGLMVPMVENVEQAKKIVRAAKFPPLGSRSFGGRRPIDLFGRAYCHADSPHQPLLICQIENKQGLENADAIAAVEGVDALYFSPDDMSLSGGMAMDKPRPEGCFDKEQKILADACKKNGKIAGGVYVNPKTLSAAVKLGYTLIACAGDVGFLADGSKQAVEPLRQCLDSTKGKGDQQSTDRQGVY